MKAKAPARPEEKAFAAAMMLSRRNYLTVGALETTGDDFFGDIEAVREVLDAANGRRTVTMSAIDKYLTRADPKDGSEWSDLVGEALTSVQISAYLLGLALGLTLGRGGQA